MDGNNMNNEYTYAADSVYDAAPAPQVTVLQSQL